MTFKRDHGRLAIGGSQREIANGSAVLLWISVGGLGPVANAVIMQCAKGQGVPHRRNRQYLAADTARESEAGGPASACADESRASPWHPDGEAAALRGEPQRRSWRRGRP
jgi:hypothetical protein